MAEATISGEMLLRVLFVCLLLVAGCTRSYPPPPQLPDPVPSSTVGPGDVLEVLVVGEEKLPKEYEIDPDGTLAFPYIDPIKVSGMEPRHIAALLAKGMVDKHYLTDPQVQVKVKQFNSKKIYVVGQVAHPGPLPFTEGMTFTQAVIASGGFTPLADQNHVQLIRLVNASKSVNAVISFDAITDNVRADVKLQQGDTIKVEQRLF